MQFKIHARPANKLSLNDKHEQKLKTIDLSDRIKDHPEIGTIRAKTSINLGQKIRPLKSREVQIQTNLQANC